VQGLLSTDADSQADQSLHVLRVPGGARVAAGGTWVER